MKKIGIIGLGGRIQSLIINEFCHFPQLQVVAVADADLEGAKKRAEEVKFLDVNKINFYEKGEEMLEKEELDGVFIGTRCNYINSMRWKC